MSLLFLPQNMPQGLRKDRRVAPSGGLERQRHGKPGDLVILCAPFLLECIGWTLDLYFMYWIKQHIGPPFSKKIVLVNDPET